MEKNNGGKLIAIIALVIAVSGLSIGFAAYTSTLNITANANVETTGDEWNVGFASAAGTMAPLDTPVEVAGTGGTGVTNAGALNMLKYTLSQKTAATLQNKSGSSATYTFKIKNAGDILANLQTITSAGISCAYNSTATDRINETDSASPFGEKITAETGDISDEVCRTMFTATLNIGGTDYNLSNLGTSFTGTIAAGSDVEASLVIAATGNNPANGADIPTGDFVVTLGTTTVVYGSN